MQAQKVNVWLGNTGWSGGGYGVGSRMKLGYTRKIIDAIHDGSITGAPTVEDPNFGFGVVTKVDGVPDEMLTPRATWDDGDAYDKAASKLAGLFVENFKKFEDGVDAAVREAGPRATLNA